MARTPSMTPSEAEALLGQRGSLAVTAENKPLVKKWCTAMGIPGAYVATLAMWRLEKTYNLPNDAEYGVNWQIANAERQGQTGNDESDETETPKPVAPSTPTVPQSNDAQIQRIAALLGEMLAKPGCDETMVSAIVERKWAELPDLIAKHSPITRVAVSVNGEAHKAIDGHTHKLLPQMIEAVAQGIPVMQVGPAGGGKSTAGEQVAHALGLTFYIQGAASGTHEYIGYKDAAGIYHTTPFRQAFEHGGLFQAEELDSGSADVPLILNAGLANGHMAFPDSTVPVKRHKDFRIIANANTYGTGADRTYVGRTQLDGATIDRFAFLDWDYDTALERKLAGNDSWVDRVQSIRRGVEAEKARIIVSPRASINGAKMIAAGWSFDQCETAFIWKGTDKETRRRILARAN